VLLAFSCPSPAGWAAVLAGFALMVIECGALVLVEGDLEGFFLIIMDGLMRVAVMRHLEVLAAAGLVTSRKRGRERWHYLNAVHLELTGRFHLGVALGVATFDLVRTDEGTLLRFAFRAVGEALLPCLPARAAGGDPSVPCRGCSRPPPHLRPRTAPSLNRPSRRPAVGLSSHPM
jgi:DNA-binding transcriptional ArsR family regulator